MVRTCCKNLTCYWYYYCHKTKHYFTWRWSLLCFIVTFSYLIFCKTSFAMFYFCNSYTRYWFATFYFCEKPIYMYLPYTCMSNMHVKDIFIVFHIYEIIVLANIVKRKYSQIKGGSQKSNCLSKKTWVGLNFLISLLFSNFGCVNVLITQLHQCLSVAV